MKATPEPSPIQVPLDYPTSMIYVDESGTAGNGPVFVLGALKVRRHGAMVRGIRAVRDKTNFTSEFRFNRVSQASAYVFNELLTVLALGDVFFAATIVDRRLHDPFTPRSPRWKCQAEIASRLLRAAINRRELVSVAMDEISTPPDVAMEDEIARRVNRGFKNKSVISAAMLDSRSCDGLQLVDVLTSAVAFDYRRRTEPQARLNAHKLAVTTQVMRMLDVVELEGRAARMNIQVLKGAGRKSLKSDTVVPMKGRRAG